MVRSGTKPASSVALGTDQQLADEERVPGKLGEDARLDPVVRIGAAIEILREQLLAARMRDEVFIQALEIGRRDLAVAFPPDRALGEIIDDGVLVLGRAAGMDAGLRAERAAFDHGGLAGRDGMLIEGRRGQIPMNRGEVLEAEFVGAVGCCSSNPSPARNFLHSRPAGAGHSPTAVASEHSISLAD